jgi:hypothetical protein
VLEVTPFDILPFLFLGDRRSEEHAYTFTNTASHVMKCQCVREPALAVQFLFGRWLFRSA